MVTVIVILKDLEDLVGFNFNCGFWLLKRKLVLFLSGLV